MIDLEMMLPLALRWSQKLEERIALLGMPLNSFGIDMARSVGVQRPDLIRIQVVDQIPIPAGPMLKEMVQEIGVISPNTIGITVGHSVLVKSGKVDNRVLLHEFRHVHQYEEEGDLEKYIEKYLLQVSAFGYENAPLEIDARKYEVQE